MWNSNDSQMWNEALDRYWTFVKPSHIDLEKEMGRIEADTVRRMDAEEWYDFLKGKYFRWKYTAPNRYATTTKALRTYREEVGLTSLFTIKNEHFEFDKNDIAVGLRIATSIRGLGTAGASGLLAILFPPHFGTVDQFAVKALSEIQELPEIQIVRSMKPLYLTNKDGVVLVTIMRRKAEELNAALSTSLWTPRRIDMVLWTSSL